MLKLRYYKLGKIFKYGESQSGLLVFYLILFI